METFFAQCHHELLLLLSANQVLDKLYTSSIISWEEREIVGDLYKIRNRRELLRLMRKKDPQCLSHFISIIKECSAGNEHFIRKMEDCIQEKHKYQPPAVENIKLAVWFGMSDVVHNFTGRDIELKELHEILTNISDDLKSAYTMIASISGLGGIGKTTLAKRYAYKMHDYFKGNIIWINAESEASMRRSFSNLSETLGLKQKAIDNLDEIVISKVYQWFGSRTCLFIFDNVTEYEGKNGIKSYLPVGLPPLMMYPYLLTTSRISGLTKKSKTMRLGPLAKENCVKLFQNELGPLNTVAAQKLAQKLGQLPLALQQAITYITTNYNLNDKNNDAAVEKYISEFDAHSMSLLKTNVHVIDNYESTAYTTWIGTLVKVQSLEYGSQAIHILRCVAYLNPNSVDIELLHMCESDFQDSTPSSVPWVFSKIYRIWFNSVNTIDKLPQDNVTLNSVIVGLKLLKNYSMIDFDSDCSVQVNPMVQCVVRTRLTEKEEIEILRRLVDVFRSLKMEHLKKQMDSHGDTLQSFLQKYEQLLPGFNMLKAGIEEQAKTLSRAEIKSLS